MRLIFFSGALTSEYDYLIKEYAHMTGNKGHLAYIPSCSSGALPYFESFGKLLRKHGVKRTEFFPLDLVDAKKRVKKLLQFDAIFLSGGNTFYFLKHLLSSGALPVLRTFAKQGGALAGQSAGAIIMTKNINIAALPESGDVNEVRLKSHAGLGLTQFEFFPHFNKSHTSELKKYSLRGTSAPIYTADESAGIIVNDALVSFYGNTQCFSQGSVYSVSNAITS